MAQFERFLCKDIAWSVDLFQIHQLTHNSWQNPSVSLVLSIVLVTFSTFRLVHQNLNQSQQRSLKRKLFSLDNRHLIFQTREKLFIYLCDLLICGFDFSFCRIKFFTQLKNASLALIGGLRIGRSDKFLMVFLKINGLSDQIVNHLLLMLDLVVKPAFYELIFWKLFIKMHVIKFLIMDCLNSDLLCLS